MKIKIMLLISLIVSIGIYAGTGVLLPHDAEAKPSCESCG